jgi:phosphoribosylformimino-5-aminoimidazole carboxamide ribotide isomerase
MEFRPCIDIHNGKVKQIVGASLNDNNEAPSENYVSSRGADFYARMYKELGLKGGHIILLNPADSPYYELTRHQGIRALSATPGLLQIGGGVTPDNAASYIEAGASHVIVTSYVFSGGKIKKNNLKKLVRTVGSERLVLDLSCKKRDGDYYIVTDRWQKFTDVKLCAETMDELSQYCDEFLVHAADVEGQQNGIEENVARILGEWAQKPVTYAGGVKSLKDIDKLKKIGKGKVDVTVGSALDIFGGHLSMDEVIKKCR